MPQLRQIVGVNNNLLLVGYNFKVETNILLVEVNTLYVVEKKLMFKATDFIC